MSTDSGPFVEIPTFKVLFATDGDSAELVADVLTRTHNTYSVYAVLHNCYSLPECTTVNLQLCLPARRPGCGDKCPLLLPLTLTSTAAANFLLSGNPIPVNELQKLVNLKLARKNFKPLLDILMCGHKMDPGRNDLYSIIQWFREKFIAGLRKMYRMSPSPHWLLTTFGTYETQFVLVASTFFFEDHDCTIDTLGHLAWLFCKNRGLSLASVNSLRELGAMFRSSPIRDKIPEFVEFIKLKLSRDNFESTALDNSVDQLRGQLALSNQDLVHFIYQSFFQSLNRENFIQYTDKTSPENLPFLTPCPILEKFIDSDFRTKMTTYYNKASYLSTYIKTCYIYDSGVGGYSKETLFGLNYRYWCGQTLDMQKFMKEVNTMVPELHISPDLQGLLSLAALADHWDDNPKEPLFGHISKNPVYRCQFLNKHFFVMMDNDAFDKKLSERIFFPGDPEWPRWHDMKITQNITYSDTFFSLDRMEPQLLISRHEVFNNRLPVFNWVLDLDLPLEATEHHLDSIYGLATRLRACILDILQLIGDVTPEHPVYFFKSTCPPLDGYGEDHDLTFCHCSKMGFRIITPLPKGVAIVGTDAMVSLTQILNRSIRLDPFLMQEFPSMRESLGPFDTAIYSNGHSIRLPHTYKVDSVGQTSRLLKLFVCHPSESDKSAYVKNACSLRCLLHHSDPYESGTNKIKLFFKVSDTDHDFLAKKAVEHLPFSRTQDVIQDIEMAVNMNILAWVESHVWPKVQENIFAYLPEDKTSQFQRVTLSQNSGNLIQVKPQRGSNFKCLKFNHRNKSLTSRVFLTLYKHSDNSLIVTLMSQCFATKCGNNRPGAIFSIRVQLVD
ncbi:helicase-primase primase subunit [Saguinine gammaherpesvirus 1]|uniref:Helicase-primase primase subunit n=1 Tax=Saguinine gammaherpesvirus 1 TaxID=2169901 RepID=A0A9Q8VHD2_9GAMA|nr:helicase-primase primase subunit [Saguinine gammaherpesvirus 1]